MTPAPRKRHRKGKTVSLSRKALIKRLDGYAVRVRQLEMELSAILNSTPMPKEK